MALGKGGSVSGGTWYRWQSDRWHTLHGAFRVDLTVPGDHSNCYNPHCSMMEEEEEEEVVEEEEEEEEEL